MPSTAGAPFTVTLPARIRSSDFRRAAMPHSARKRCSRSSGEKGASTNKSLRTDRERVVMPSQITGWPDLTGYLAFVGNLPIAKFELSIQPFVAVNPPFVQRESAA